MRKKQINEIEKVLRSGSIWLGKKPKDGDVLTPHGNTPFGKEEESKDRFRHDAKTDKLIKITESSKNES